MTDQDSNKRISKLLYRALVPKGFRPRTDVDIERMLETIGGEPLSDEKLQRMLRKINGHEPMGQRIEDAHPVPSAEITEKDRELIALHRAQGKPLPAALEAKLKEMEERAAKLPEEDGTENGE